MKKISKNLNNNPSSLNSETTKKRRKELIDTGNWINENVYTSRYKQDDIKRELDSIYHNKCAYCESRVEELHVEHFRPKSIYYWLTYSWDNLMLCCPTCNKKKNNTFEVDKKVSINDFDIKDIHNLNVVYDKFEQNKLVNPEKEDVSDKIFFTKEGEIFSHDERINSTIDVCQLNRKKLIEFRKPIYDTLEKEILSRKNEKQELKRRIKEFIEETNLLQTEFYSFRTFIYKYLIKEIINTANIR
jgi:uncharacterized protein (TIGR02646 family)